MEHQRTSNARDPSEQHRDVLYQVSLLQGLTNGDYDGSVTVAELKRHGDTGIGTFHKLNGELIMLDGRVYRAAGDGNFGAVFHEEPVKPLVTFYFGLWGVMHQFAAFTALLVGLIFGGKKDK